MKDSVTAEGGNYGNAELSPGSPAPCMCSLLCVCTLWVKCRAQIPSMGNHTWSHVTSLLLFSINPVAPALRNVMSHCGENTNGRPSETDLV